MIFVRRNVAATRTAEHVMRFLARSLRYISIVVLVVLLAGIALNFSGKLLIAQVLPSLAILIAINALSEGM